MKRLKHLPPAQWPAADHAAFEAAYAPGGTFDDARGPGAHLTEGTRGIIRTTYRRWLAFLTECHPDDLLLTPVERITPQRVRAFIEHLSLEVGLTSQAIACGSLLYAARLFAPQKNWDWLRSLKRRLHVQARPEDRFTRLVPGWQTLDLGIQSDGYGSELLVLAAHGPRDPVPGRPTTSGAELLADPTPWHLGAHRQLVTSSLSMVACTSSCMQRTPNLKRPESCRMPEYLVPYFLRYLHEMRPRLLRGRNHDGLWASYRGRPLVSGRISDIVRRETKKAFGKAMSLHDFRRAAATFLATIAPDQVGLIPAVLQHASPEMSQRHYNLARSVEASRRFAAHLAQTRGKLQSILAYKED